MEIRDYARQLRKWWWLIVIATILAGAAGFLIVRQQPAFYQTHTTLQIGSSILEDPNPAINVVYITQQLALTYAEISRRSEVRRATMEALGLEELPEYTVSPVPSTQLFEIAVTDTSPERAQAVANELANQLILQSPTNSEQEERARQEFINQQLDELETNITLTQTAIADKQEELKDLFSARQIAEAESEILELQTKLNDLQSNYAELLANSKRGAVNILTVIEPAQLPEKPIGPNNSVITLLAAFIGLTLSITAVLVVEYLDDSIKTPDDIARVIGLPTLAGIARIKSEEEREKLVTLAHPRSPVSEAYRVLRTGLQFSSVDDPDRTTLLITSANPTEGKSLTAANLAVVVAQAGHNVLLVDADLRRPRQHRIFDVNKNRGLTSFLLEFNLASREEETLNLLKQVIQPTSVPGLHVLTSGPIPPNPSELLGSAKMKASLATLAEHYDYVIIDSPPALAVTDAVVLSTQVDSVLLISDANRTRQAHLKQLIDQLREVNAHVIGVVLNRLSPRGDGYYYYYYYRNSYYLDKSEETEKQPSANGKANGSGLIRRKKKQVEP
ncbi:MAG: polysaccharide biosynthesis tyrosine autokinase [Chloroflexi bacterium]|nr:polysaccharide biosynthesis tyrosine autokinase [Chloroflexota bacterium]MCI0725600.1 polysaccharide biosynthesis tyrosine autokinase [Chloroflexota bacterium]